MRTSKKIDPKWCASGALLILLQLTLLTFIDSVDIFDSVDIVVFVFVFVFFFVFVSPPKAMELG